MSTTGRSLDELDEHSAGRGRVNKRDEVPASAWPGRLVDEPGARRAHPVERGADVRHAVTDVVQPGAALREELAHGRVRPGGFEQLDARLADGEHRHPDALVLDGLAS